MSDNLDPKQPREQDEATLGEQIGESMRSEDEPLENTKPSAPLALVMGSYPIILIILLLAIAAYFFWFRAAPEEENINEPARPADVAPRDEAPATTPAEGV